MHVLDPFDNVKVGDRVFLIKCEDPYTNLSYGSLGTVNFIDDTRTVHVQWDSGCHLGLLPDYDFFKIIK